MEGVKHIVTALTFIPEPLPVAAQTPGAIALSIHFNQLSGLFI
jgi:hypothetical protein